MQSCPGRRAAVAGDERTTNAVDGRVPRPFAGKVDALILDHAGNTLGHASSKTSSLLPNSRRSRNARTSERARPCRPLGLHCNAINPIHDDICMECGTPRRRNSKLVVLDGELGSVEVKPNRTPPGPTLADLYAFYGMAIGYGRESSSRMPRHGRSTRRSVGSSSTTMPRGDSSPGAGATTIRWCPTRAPRIGSSRTTSATYRWPLPPTEGPISCLSIA